MRERERERVRERERERERVCCILIHRAYSIRMDKGDSSVDWNVKI